MDGAGTIDALEDGLPAHLRAHCIARGGLRLFHHPFLVSLLLPGMQVDIAALLARKIEMASARREARDFSGLLILVERPYRMDALQELVEEGAFEADPAAYWSLARWVWMDAECDEADPAWARLLDAALPRGETFMTPADRRALAAMPDHLHLWRGVQAEDKAEAFATCLSGHSWTLERDVALRFAHRGLAPPDRPWIAEARLPREIVRGYLRGRGEAEIVIRPEDVDPGAVQVSLAERTEDDFVPLRDL
jgi:hypothetical protein